MAKRGLTKGVEETRYILSARIKLAREQYARLPHRATRRRVLNIEIDASILSAAQKRTGIRNHAKLVESALILLATEDDFGLKLLRYQGMLSPDFELAT